MSKTLVYLDDQTVIEWDASNNDPIPEWVDDFMLKTRTMLRSSIAIMATEQGWAIIPIQRITKIMVFK